MEHAELIETAGVNYLQSLKTWPKGFSAASQITAGQAAVDKSAQWISFAVEGELGPEDPPCSGNRWAEVRVELKTPVAVQTPDQASATASDPADNPTPLTIHSQAAAALSAAILNANLPTLLTNAVPGFTVWGVIDRNPIREQTEDYWLSGWSFKLLSCPSSFPN